MSCTRRLSSLLLGLLAFTAAAPTSKLESTNAALKFITLEEHFDSPAVRSWQEKDGVYDVLIDALGSSLNPTLRNISLRIPDMDTNNVRVQVVANDPEPYVLTRPRVARAANDELAEAISHHPDRFRGFCFLPMAIPEKAAQELERCVSQLGFLGALVDSHLLNQTFYDDREYDVLWNMFEKLNVPIYLHPTYPPTSSVNSTGGLYAADHDSFSTSVSSVLGTAGWGWHSDTGISFVRLWLSGVFDRHPNLKVVLGHMGDMVPYMLHRIDYTLGPTKPKGLTVLEAYAQNIWVTTSGMFSLVPFRSLLAATAMEKILYSVDYSWARNEDGAKFMKELKESGLVSEAEWDGIAYGHAEKLLGLS